MNIEENVLEILLFITKIFAWIFAILALISGLFLVITRKELELMQDSNKRFGILFPGIRERAAKLRELKQFLEMRNFYLAVFCISSLVAIGFSAIPYLLGIN
ncbi:MAG: hypothetical protein AAB513_00030 [Patescibacteria group bacterium]